MKLSDIKLLIREELSRFQFMKHLAEKHPNLGASQIGDIYKLYKKGVDIDAAVAQVASMEEQEAAPQRQALGTQTVSKSKQASLAQQKGKAIASGDALGGIDNRERAIMVDLEKLIAAIAEKDDLVKYKSALQAVVDKIRKDAGV